MSRRPTGAVLRDIEEFKPTNGNWLALDDLLAELWATGVTEEHLALLFRVFERFPNDDGAGVLWGIVHGIEALPLQYEERLRESMTREPSLMGKIMLQRIENGRRAAEQR